ncbi:hypothetical protein XENOCAPTIV_029007 [Xenoophorus captivus]|uniref:Cleavage/polyadenylation specificity factor A subunit N-terminal domain-containing protein n=1 Tax=Xenoophorus captivus TaxID=1517983 RepID=A0ABV0RMG0_9TELE
MLWRLKRLIPQTERGSELRTTPGQEEDRTRVRPEAGQDPGELGDYIVVGSDSGRIVILEYHPSKNQFEKVHQETFGKSGCRRIVPGQFLAVDPKGRAVMIANTLVYHVVGVDVGFENPMFACLEMDYENDLDDPERGMIFVCSATHKTKSMFFFLAQTEQGDIFKVSEMAVSELPGNPNAVWTVRRHVEDEFDAYIIVSFVNATLVLSIGETVEEVTDSGFLGTTPTLSCSLLGEDALVQVGVYPDGIRHIRADKRVNEWKTPGKKTIVRCAVNQRQVVIALTGGELVYFEMDPSGQLNEYTERKEMSADVVCMSLANVPPGEQRSRFLAVGLVDNTVRIISLDPSALPAQPESLCIVEMGGVEKQDEIGEKGTIGFLYLNIGLQNGVLLRTVLDPVTGDLSDTRTRYLGSRPVKLFRVRMQGQEAVRHIYLSVTQQETE